MDFVQFLNEVKTSSDREVQSIAATYGIDFTTSEIRKLRPLLDEISFHWIITGIPDSFIYKVQEAIGPSKTEFLLQMYMDTLRK